jgi:hypothetical protein
MAPMQRQHIILLLGFTLLLVSLSSAGIVYSTFHSSSHRSVVPSQQSEAEQAISAAQTAINVAYNNLVVADRTGAPISDLIDNLNTAITYLNQARTAYTTTDYATAITQAENAQNTANSITEQSQTRRFATLAQLQVQLFLAIAVTVIVILITYFAVTRWYKYQKQQRRDLLQMEIRLPQEDEEGEDT